MTSPTDSTPALTPDLHAKIGGLPDVTGGKRRRRKHGTRKGMVRKTARRAYIKSKKRGGTFLNRLLVPGALIVGQKAFQSRRKDGTRKGRVPKTARRAYMKSK